MAEEIVSNRVIFKFGFGIFPFTIATCSYLIVLVAVPMIEISI